MLLKLQFYIKILSTFKNRGLRAILLFVRLIIKFSINNSDSGASINSPEETF